MKYILLLGLSIAMSVAYGQQTYSEKEIQQVDRYLAANQKKILQKWEDAIEIYEAILKDDPLNAAVHHDMARIFLAQEKWDDAKKYGRNAAKYEPENVWYHQTYATICETVGDFDSAAKAYGQIKKRSNDPIVYDNWSRLLVEANKPMLAIQALDQAEAKFGIEESWVENKVNLYLSLKKKKQAEAELLKLVAYNNFNPNSHLRLADFYLLTGNKKKAKRAYEEVVKLDETNEFALLSLRSLDGKKDKETNSLISFIQDERIGIDAKIKAVITILQKSKTEDQTELEQATSQLVQMYPDQAKVHALRADFLSLQNNTEEAITSYEQTLRIDKSIFDVWDQLMASYLYVKRYEDLEKLANNAIDHYPNQASPYYYLGYAYYGLKKYAQAIEYANEADFIAAGNVQQMEANTMLVSRVQAEQGNLNAAVSTLEKFTSNVNSPNCLELIGDLYNSNGEKDKAVKSWKEAISKGGNAERITTKIQAS